MKFIREKYEWLIWLGLFVALAIVVWRRGVNTWEVEFFERIRSIGGLEGVAEVLAWVGSGWAVAVIAGGLLLWRKPRWAMVIGGTGLVEGALNGLIKQMIARQRPEEWLGLVEVQAGVSGYGFPSGHTTLATALVVIVAPVVQKKWRWLIWLYPVLMGWSRIYLGKHWLLDVIGGWVLGIGLGLVVRSARSISKDVGIMRE